MDLTTYLNNQNKMGAMQSASGLFGQFIGQNIEYNQLKIDANNYLINANSIELQARQQANNLRQQFIEAVGNYKYGAARRGIDVKSSIVSSNIERSAEELGKDIQQMQDNAGMQANLLRSQAKMQKRQAKYGAIMGTLQTLGTAGMNYSQFMNNKEMINSLGNLQKQG